MDIKTFYQRSQSARDGQEKLGGKPPAEESAVEWAILESWRRLQASQMDPNVAMLPQATSADKESVTRYYTEYLTFLHDRHAEFHELQERLLAGLGGAALYLDNHLRMFHKGGNKALLKHLRDINVKYGFCFDETRAGTNAASFSSITQDISWIVGPEHYCKPLQPYLTCCSAPIRQGLVQGYLMLVFPIEEITQLTLDTAEYVLRSYCHLYDYGQLLENRSHAEIIKAALNRSNSHYFLCDTLGRLIEASPGFYDLFGLGPKETASRPMEDVLAFYPPLSNCIARDCAHTLTCSVKLPQSEKHLRCTMECSPVHDEDDGYVGMVFILTESNAMSTYARKVTGDSPYYTFDRLVGTSQPFRFAIRQGMAAASSTSNVLIQGESGTGKDLFAQSIHNRRFHGQPRPFVALNCGALPRDLLNTELFGYVEGAFTGARKGGAPGKFELADGGTLFLDEIAEMPLEMQAALLRTLETKSVMRVGGSKSIPVEVDIISATNKDLWTLVQNGSFRLDLYYRLNVMPIYLPPLRERGDDIIMLANNFLVQLSGEAGKDITGMTPEYMQALVEYPWPGNVRELRNVIERSVNMCDGDMLADCTSINGYLPYHASLPQAQGAYGGGAVSATLAVPTSNYREIEIATIRRLLFELGGNKTAVAEAMGISRKTLYNKMRKYKIPLH